MSNYQKEYNSLPRELKTEEFMCYLFEDKDFKQHTYSLGEPLEDWYDIRNMYNEETIETIDKSINKIMKETTKEILIEDVSIISGNNSQDIVHNFETLIKKLIVTNDIDETKVVNLNLKQEYYHNGYGDDIFLVVTSEDMETEEELQERLWSAECKNKKTNFQKFLDKKINQYPLYLKKREIEKLTKEMEDLTKRIKK